MIALKAAYIEGFHAARETDGNSAFEAWLHSAAKLSAFPPSSPWLPIESAPKDGSRILAKDNYDDETVVLWSHGRNEWRLNIGGFHEDTKHDFTYWMPLHTAVALPPSSPVADCPVRERPIQQLRDVLSMLCHFVWHRQTRPGDHMWSIPVNKERDFDCILSDAIDELEHRRKASAPSPSAGAAKE